MRVCPRCDLVYSGDHRFCGVDGTILHEEERDPLIGKTIARYVIEDRIAFGGMGRIYRARHSVLDRRFAIKVLFGDIAANPRLVERFRREADAVAKMEHPNIVQVIDFGETSAGIQYTVMELVRGRTLAEALGTEGPFPVTRAAQVAEQIAAGLGEAHRRGFIHRDLKPSNVMLGLADEAGREQVKILDFGLVGYVDQKPDDRLTQKGMVLGTALYMAPEQARGADVAPSADLYALGVIMYEMIAGKPPFMDPDLLVVLRKHGFEPPPPLAGGGGLSPVVMRLLEKNPANRYPTAADARTAIVESVEGVLPRGSSSSGRTPAPRRPSPAPETPAVDTLTVPNPPRPARPRALAFVVPIALAATAIAMMALQTSRAPELGPPQEPEPAEQAAPRHDRSSAPSGAPAPPVAPVPARTSTSAAAAPPAAEHREPTRADPRSPKPPRPSVTRASTPETQSTHPLARLESRLDRLLEERGLELADLERTDLKAAARRLAESRAAGRYNDQVSALGELIRALEKRPPPKAPAPPR